MHLSFAAACGLTLLVPMASADESASANADMSPLIFPPLIFADGSGLPPGSGNAREGTGLYQTQCARCHGRNGEGGRALELVGDRETLISAWPDRGIGVSWPYAPPLFDYIRRAMPPDSPYSLSVDDTYSIVARVLELNALVDADTTVDAAFLSSLVMPNNNGFKQAIE